LDELTEHSEIIPPWYKQFWPWFIISFPASAVIAGLITVYIAFENADSLVVDDYYKSGLAINTQIKQRKYAANLGYAAILRRMPDNRLFLKFDNASPEIDSINLSWVHPVDGTKDFSLQLKKQQDGSYQARSDNELNGRWYLRLSDNDKWLLKSEISGDKDIVHLTPQLQ